MRSAVALLITMIFIVAILATVGGYFAYANRAFERSGKLEELVQTNVILRDLKSGLLAELADLAKKSVESSCEVAENKNQCKSETLAAILDGFYGLPLSFPVGKKEAVITCLPAGTKLDINMLNSANDYNRSIFLKTKVDRYFQDEYRLYASWQFFELLEFVFDKSEERFGYLKNDERLASASLPKGAVRSIRDLKKIAKDYEILTNDRSINDIPFEEIFVFESKRDRFSFDYMEKTSCQIAFGKYSPVCELLGKKATFDDVDASDSEAGAVIKNLKIDFGYNPVLDCRVTFRSDGLSNSYGFIFDIDNKTLDRFTIEH